MSQAPAKPAEPSPAPTPVDPNAPSMAALIVGWVLTILPAVGLIMSAVMKFVQPDGAEFAKNIDHIGWKMEYVVGLGILELACVAIYLLPWTSVLGAILITGYLGGAIATHVRIGEFDIAPHIIIAVLAWLGLFFRIPKLQTLVPFKF